MEVFIHSVKETVGVVLMGLLFLYDVYFTWKCIYMHCTLNKTPYMTMKVWCKKIHTKCTKDAPLREPPQPQEKIHVHYSSHITTSAWPWLAAQMAPISPVTSVSSRLWWCNWTSRVFSVLFSLFNTFAH